MALSGSCRADARADFPGPDIEEPASKPARFWFSGTLEKALLPARVGEELVLWNEDGSGEASRAMLASRGVASGFGEVDSERRGDICMGREDGPSPLSAILIPLCLSIIAAGISLDDGFCRRLWNISEATGLYKMELDRSSEWTMNDKIRSGGHTEVDVTLLSLTSVELPPRSGQTFTSTKPD